MLISTGVAVRAGWKGDIVEKLKLQQNKVAANRGPLKPLQTYGNKAITALMILISLHAINQIDFAISKNIALLYKEIWKCGFFSFRSVGRYTYTGSGDLRLRGPLGV